VRAQSTEHKSWPRDSKSSFPNDRKKKPYSSGGKPRSASGEGSSFHKEKKHGQKAPFAKDGAFRKFSK